MTVKPIIKYGGYLIVEGSDRDKFTIIAAVTESGQCPFKDYYDGLIETLNKKVEKGVKVPTEININLTSLKYYFEKFSKDGPWSNPVQLKPLEDGFFEFKVKTGLRIPFYYDDKNRSVIIITHCFEKKSQKTPTKELIRMKDIKARFERRRLKRGKYDG